MTVWNHNISWSKIELAIKCHKALQYACEKTPVPGRPITYWADLGKLVQKTYEMYFNQGLNHNPRARSADVMEKAARKVLDSQFRTLLDTAYPYDKVPEDLDKEVIAQVRQGYQFFEEMGILDKKVQSELKITTVFNGFRIFALLDFLYQDKGKWHVVDGKGHRDENANPDQVRYFALAVAASGRQLGQSGLLYWRHGFREVDVSPKSLKEFVDEVLNPVRPIFMKLRSGTDEFPANPSDENCKFCKWRLMCTDSVAYRKPVTDTTPGNVEF